MSADRTYSSIWYRSEPIVEPSAAHPFVRERGTLVVGGEGLRFQGATTTVDIRQIESIAYGPHGSMANPSIHVRYRDGDAMRDAYFTDGRIGGYAGLFGGTRSLAESMRHLAPVTIDEAGAGRSQKQWIIALAIVVAIFLLLVLRRIGG